MEIFIMAFMKSFILLTVKSLNATVKVSYVMNIFTFVPCSMRHYESRIYEYKSTWDPASETIGNILDSEWEPEAFYKQEWLDSTKGYGIKAPKSFFRRRL